jgi:hypothetical protein
MLTPRDGAASAPYGALVDQGEVKMRKTSLLAVVAAALVAAAGAAYAATTIVSGTATRGNAVVNAIDTSTSGNIVGSASFTPANNVKQVSFYIQGFDSSGHVVGPSCSMTAPASAGTVGCTLSNAPAGHYEGVFQTFQGKASVTVTMVSP